MEETEKDGYILYGIDYTLTDFEEICRNLAEDEEELKIIIFS